MDSICSSEMPRRAFMALVSGALLAAPLAARAQQAGKIPRIGFLRAGPPPKSWVEGFQQGLRDLGYVEGQNIVTEYRYGEGKADRYPRLAAELVRLKVDVIVVAGGGDRAILAATDECLAGKSISDGAWAEVTKHVTDPGQQVEFIIAMGNWMMFSLLFRNLRIPLAEGIAIWPPDGLASPAAEA